MSSELPLRRSTKNIVKPDRYGFSLVSAANEQHALVEAISIPDKAKWQEVMEKEMKSLHLNEVWKLVETPPNRRIVGSKWIFKWKFGADGSVQRYKARFGCPRVHPEFGLDYEETFSPVIRFESVRSVIALGAQLKLHVSTTFLIGVLQEEVYMRQPEGFIQEGTECLVCRLNRSIYGLKQSPHCWNHALDSQLKEMQFMQTSNVYYCYACG